MTTIAGDSLKVGDVIKYWSFSEAGARVESIRPYSGPLRDIIRAHMSLSGKHSLHGDRHTMETAIEHGSYFEVPE